MQTDKIERLGGKAVFVVFPRGIVSLPHRNAKRLARERQA
jgi:hypothetical protein